MKGLAPDLLKNALSVWESNQISVSSWNSVLPEDLLPPISYIPYELNPRASIPSNIIKLLDIEMNKNQDMLLNEPGREDEAAYCSRLFNMVADLDAVNVNYILYSINLYLLSPLTL